MPKAQALLRQPITNKQTKNLVDAIEALIDAKVEHMMRLAESPEKARKMLFQLEEARSDLIEEIDLRESQW